MKNRGMTLLEVMLASAILMLVLIVIYGLFNSGDRLYQGESVLRDAQFSVRRAVEQVSQELAEAGPGFVWTWTDAAMGSPPNAALAILSARDSDSFSGVTHGDAWDPAHPPVMQMQWACLIVYLIHVDPQGVLHLRRHEIPVAAAPTRVTASFGTSMITVTMTIDGVDVPTVLDRSRGALAVEALSDFSVQVSTPSGVGPSASPLESTRTVMIGRKVRVPPNITTRVTMSATISPRN